MSKFNRLEDGVEDLVLNIVATKNEIDALYDQTSDEIRNRYKEYVLFCKPYESIMLNGGSDEEKQIAKKTIVKKRNEVIRDIDDIIANFNSKCLRADLLMQSISEKVKTC